MDLRQPCPSCGTSLSPTALRCSTCGERTLTLGTSSRAIAGSGSGLRSAAVSTPTPTVSGMRRVDRGLQVQLTPGFTTRRGRMGLHHVRSHCGRPDLFGVEVRSQSLTREGPFQLELEVPGYCAPWRREIPDVRRLSPATFEDVRLNWLIDSARSPREADPAATLEVRLRSGSDVVFSETHPVDVFAWNEWRFELDEHADVLAAYIQPNLPELADVLSAARRHLKAAHGSDALCGYQMGKPAWVQAMTAAVHEALRADSGIGYINPPASFEDGQKILLSGDIVSQKLGTCLDLTLLQCGLLERIGLHPVVVVVQGHAFPAVWTREDRALGGVDDLGGALEAGLLPFNSTDFCDGRSFEEAVATARRILKTTPLMAVVDVRVARGRGARPLM